MNKTQLSGSSWESCRSASRKGILSISPTVPPTSTMQISCPFATCLILRLMSSMEIIEFGVEDIVRSGLVKEYLLAKLEMGL